MIASFQNLGTIFKISAKIVILTKMIGEHSICNFSTNCFRGQGNSSGRRRNIAESFTETLGTILGKCYEF